MIPAAAASTSHARCDCSVATRSPCFPLGGPTGVEVEQLLKEEKIDYRPLAIAGLTRENFTVDERQTGRQFRFVMAGPTLTEIEQERCLDQISSLEPKPAYIVGSGSLPLGSAP